MSISGSTRRQGMRLLYQTTRCASTSSVGTQAWSSTTLPTSADVVVIGGGSIGCHTLYQLAKHGVTSSVLIERDLLTSGTTWHTAGLMSRIRSSEVDFRLTDLTWQLAVHELEKETGLNAGWTCNGSLVLATNYERLRELQRQSTLMNALGLECKMITAADVRDLYPVMRLDDVIGALYCPSDGLLDPSALMSALTKAATQRGAKLIERCSVTGVDTQVDDYGMRHVNAVHTSLGTIKTKAIVCAAGAWSPKLGAMVGVPVPLQTFKHCYVVTDTIAGLQAVPNVRDSDYQYYLRSMGTAVEVGGFETSPVPVDMVPDDFSFSLYDFPWDSFSDILNAGIRRLPQLEYTGIKSEVSGPETFTPDHIPLLGEAPQCRGFYLATGCNSQGMQFGGGFGQQIAHWIINGRPSLHMHKFDIRRFNRDLTLNKQWIFEKSQEGVATHYSIGFPLDEPLAGRNMIQDALHEALLERGAIYEEKEGWERPKWFATDGQIAPVLPYDYYGSYGHDVNKTHPYWHEHLAKTYTWDYPKNFNIIANECLSCRNRAAFFNMSSFGKFTLTGPEAQQAADWIFTANMEADVGSTIYTLVLNKQGLVESDLTVSILSSSNNSLLSPNSSEGERGFYVVTGGSVKNHLRTLMEQEIQEQGLKAKLVDLARDICMLSVQGPYSRSILQPLIDVNLDNESFPFSSHRMANFAGIPCRVLRVSFVGELGFELHVPAERAVDAYNILMEAGKPYGLVNAGTGALGSLSGEKGYALWGQDIWAMDNPFEIGLGFTCKLKTTTPFCGREAVEAAKQKKNRKRLVSVYLDRPKYLWGCETLYRDGVFVGHVRRAEYAHYLNKSMGYVMVQHPSGDIVTPEWIKSGTYQLEVFGEYFPVSVSLRSLFDPKNDRLMGIYNHEQIVEKMTAAMGS